VKVPPVRARLPAMVKFPVGAVNVPPVMVNAPLVSSVEFGTA